MEIIFFVGTGNGVFLSTNFGINWNAVSNEYYDDTRALSF